MPATKYSTTQHGGAWLARDTSGQALPTFVLDLAGRVVFHVNGCPLAGELPPGAQVLVFADEGAPREPWACTYKEFMRRLDKVFEHATPQLADDLGRCYPGRRLARVLRIAFPQPTTETPISATDARSVIQAIGAKDADDALKEEALQVLQDAGVDRIPDAPVFCALYHDGRNVSLKEGQKIRTTRPGWVMNGQVLIKSTVEPA